MPLQVMLNVIGVIPKVENVLIVDPFCGTGTTLVAAARLGYPFVGFDINGDYVAIANERVKNEGKKPSEQLRLF